ncbi:MBL fold metallo-hydrolase [Treponema phagedenis]|uniref:MBL fold metallo-hydrolase n=1 Tax=Treponema phagedenis TaxID=162 RepID=A0A0B7H2C0_TREPH|nr:MBL fold metallo-hydrolase [Treponema phagedenis]EFW37636.1 metallo-beta-lactamase domain protein [Treponema phagedenis F0421]NVP24472.1 MBL fold metallo-hydrolase [Treponema phagedenis]QEJ95491.1 MBL fold metallo-hydrolase [Treponema phagedenis]QEJ97768.1 MBL fold metallo-hydrolase [Treponema phagedenis]QEK01343.1 MBL fold metallo-hydrolase [Treponema phagedenis]
MKIYFHYSIGSFTNSYLVGNEKTSEAIMVDPGRITTEIIHNIEKNNFSLRAVFITHCHATYYDHGLQTIMNVYQPEVFAADTEVDTIKTSVLRGDGLIERAGFTIEYFSVPGYSPDSYMFKIQNVLFTGDSLSAGMIGETANIYAGKNLLKNLHTKILCQDENIILFHGHGPPSSLKSELLYNDELHYPYVSLQPQG